jgi:hypothetical protein
VDHVVVTLQAGESIHELSAQSAAISSLKAENARLASSLATETEAHKETQRELRKLKRCVRALRGTILMLPSVAYHSKLAWSTCVERHCWQFHALGAIKCSC